MKVPEKDKDMCDLLRVTSMGQNAQSGVSSPTQGEQPEEGWMAIRQDTIQILAPERILD